MKVSCFQRNSRKGCGGQNTVEFALILPIFLMLIFGIIDMSRYYYYQSSLSHTIRQALREAVVYDPEATNNTYSSRRQTIIETAKKNNPGFVKIQAGASSAGSGDTLIITPADGGDAGESVTVQLKYDFVLLTPMAEFVVHQFNGGEPIEMSVQMKFRNEP